MVKKTWIHEVAKTGKSTLCSEVKTTQNVMNLMSSHHLLCSSILTWSLKSEEVIDRQSCFMEFQEK